MPQSSSTAASDPETFAHDMRQRAEEAISASVHHASLAQQYLALAQKFTGIAEQSAFGPGGLFDYAQRLTREAATGVPAAVPAFGGPQHNSTHATSTHNTSTTITPSPPRASTTVTPQTAEIATSPDCPQTTHSKLQPASDLPPEQTAAQTAAPEPTHEPDPEPDPSPPAPKPLTLHSPPARKSLDLLNRVAQSIESTSPTSTSAATPQELTRPQLPPNRARRRPRISLRRLLERFRIAANEHSEQVRLKVRKADTQPKLRKTSEELLHELKRSRRPASISSCLTVVVLGLLALGQLESAAVDPLPPLSASFSGPVEDVAEAVILDQILEQAGEQQEQPTENPQELAETPPPPTEPKPELPEPTPEPPPQLPEPSLTEPDLQLAELPLPESPNGTQPVKPATKPNTTNAKTSQYSHRTEAGRKALLAKYGGSAGSESAVNLALEWLAKRQRPDGSWDFNDVGPCTNPGRVQNPIGGTAYALLPFLAAGHTHRQGPYKKQIQTALQFLTSIGIIAPAGYDLRGVINQRDDDPEPNYAYYVHGAATLALCEAYGMTKDRTLRPTCEGAVRFLLNSQDPRGGGWRYNPQQAGSTSCTAIQVMALKAAERAGFPIPPNTWHGVSLYLDSVAVDREGRYGYEAQKKAFDISVTSMALLSRIYSGWKRDDGDLRKGIALIDRKGPYDNLYYCYFASQVMKNWGGAEWERWNERLRDDLVTRQDREGDAAGSWAPRDRSDTSVAGGRLLTTCLATLTLEVYYRNESQLDEAPELASAAANTNSPTRRSGSETQATDQDTTKQP